MEHFFDFIERNKFGLLATVLVHVIAFFALNFYYLEEPLEDVHEVSDIEIPLEEISLEDMSIQEIDDEGNVINSGEIKNTVVDQNDNREKSMDNFSKNNTDKSVEDELKQLEQQTFQELEEQGDNASEREKYEHVTDEQLEKMAKEHLANQGTSSDKSFAGRAIATFDLPGRNEVKIQIPSYTCKGSGTVVVRVKVDIKGEVISAKAAPELSYKPSSCMVEKAEAYAKRSNFDYQPDADNPQSGTITYQFIAQ